MKLRTSRRKLKKLAVQSRLNNIISQYIILFKDAMGDFRKYFGQVKKILDIPNLIDIQTQSYEKFLQKEIAPAKRGNLGFARRF